MTEYSRLIERFLDLVKINTQSTFPFEQLPSNPDEMKVISYIQDKLSFLAKDQFKIYENGTLVVSLPASPGYESDPVIAFAAHVDTSPGASGKVNPMIHEYTDGDISLPQNDILIPASSPSLTKLRKNGGGHVITGDGSSLLGADDKAGVVALMELICTISEQNIPHTRLLLMFTTDEEIGEFGSDLPKMLIDQLHLLWTVDGTTLGAIATGSQKIVRNVFTITSAQELLIGERQVSIDFKGNAAHAGLSPEHFHPANSAACDFLSSYMDIDSSCKPVFLQGSPGYASLIFADNGQSDYRICLDRILKAHSGVTTSIEEMPLGSKQTSIEAIKSIARLGQLVYNRCPVTTHRGPNGRGLINCLIVKPVDDEPGSYMMSIAVRDDTPKGLELMEGVLSAIATEVEENLDPGISLRKERSFKCENVAYAIDQNREMLIPMKEALSENHIEVVEEFACGGSDGGMLNVKYPDLPCPDIGTGAEMLHSAQEHISIEDLETLADILVSYIKCISRKS